MSKFLFGWFSGASLRGRSKKAKPARKTVRQFYPEIEYLETRLLLDNNVWLPRALQPVDGISQYSQSNQVFRPASTSLRTSARYPAG